MSRERDEYNVVILSRRDVTTWPKMGEKLVMRHTTYVAAGLPPSTVRIKKTSWTESAEARAIREDIETRLAAKPTLTRV